MVKADSANKRPHRSDAALFVPFLHLFYLT